MSEPTPPNEAAPENSWEQRYRTGDLPWDTGKPDKHLERIIEQYRVVPCPALEIGCGTGTNAVWLGQQGFDLTVVDVAPTAVEAARKAVEAAGLKARLEVADFLAGPVLPPGSVSFAFDRGCFHAFDYHRERAAFAGRVADALASGGLWLSLCGSTDEGSRQPGPPQRSALDIAAAVEARFEILLLEATRFEGKLEATPRAWACVMKKRG